MPTKGYKNPACGVTDYLTGKLPKKKATMPRLEQIITQELDSHDWEIKHHGKRYSLVVFQEPGKALDISAKNPVDLIKKIVKHYDA